MLSQIPESRCIASRPLLVESYNTLIHVYFFFGATGSGGAFMSLPSLSCERTWDKVDVVGLPGSLEQRDKAGPVWRRDEIFSRIPGSVTKRFSRQNRPTCEIDIEKHNNILCILMGLDIFGFFLNGEG